MNFNVFGDTALGQVPRCLTPPPELDLGRLCDKPDLDPTRTWTWLTSVTQQAFTSRLARPAAGRCKGQEASHRGRDVPDANSGVGRAAGQCLRRS